MKKYYCKLGIGLFFIGLLSSCASGPRRTSCSQRSWWCRIVEVDTRLEQKEKAQSVDYALEYCVEEGSY